MHVAHLLILPYKKERCVPEIIKYINKQDEKGDEKQRMHIHISLFCKMHGIRRYPTRLFGGVDMSAEQWTKHSLYILEECISNIKSWKNLPWLNTNIMGHM